MTAFIAFEHLQQPYKSAEIVFILLTFFYAIGSVNEIITAVY